MTLEEVLSWLGPQWMGSWESAVVSTPAAVPDEPHFTWKLSLKLKADKAGPSPRSAGYQVLGLQLRGAGFAWWAQGLRF